MPITLRTGLPGSAKTLLMIEEVKERSERENRPVYYHGIKGLTLTWFELDDPKQWYTLPEGSIIVIPECQDIFPVHETKLPAEEYVLQLAKHRHKGYDLYFDTQHPMNIHAYVRRLVDKHYHNIRAFGMEASNVHEWNRVIDYPEKTKKDSQTKLCVYNKEAYKYYKSSEVHTIQRKLPRKLLWLLLIPPLLGFMGWKAYSVLNPKHYKEQITGVKEIDDKTNQPKAGAGNSSQNQPKSDLTYIQAHVPEIADFPYTAPIYKEVVKPVTAPYPAACINSKSRGCKCFTQQGTMLPTSKEVCMQIVNNGFFIEWDQKSQQAQQQLKDSPIGEKDNTAEHIQPYKLNDTSLRASPSV